MGLKQLVITAFILVLVQAWCCDGCLEDERLALLQLQDHFNISWFPFDKKSNCCEWRGIECDVNTSRVTYLDLSSARDWDLGDWYLNASLLLPFKQLSFLDLSGNRINGCLQNEGFERLKSLISLEHLHLYENNLGNDILSSLSGLLTLKSLDISYNRLNGSILFEDFNNLKNLKELNFGGNEIEELVFFKGGKLRLNNLETLVMSYNRFNNNILSSLEDLAGLKNLYLAGNQLSGPFNVTMLAVLGSLELLGLSGNTNISEFVASKDVRTPTNLKTVYLNSMAVNDMSHLLKSVGAHFPYLKALSLRWNNFTESTFSYGLCSLNHLESLDLSRNYFSGELPWCLANLTSLQHLDLYYSFLKGSLYSSPLGLLTHLQYLDLGEIHFNGTLPLWLANLTSLQHLDLSSNSLVGNLSSSSPILIASVQHLDLSGNNFQIPISLVPFYNCSNLYYLSLLGNELYEETEWHNLIPKFQLEELCISGDGCGVSFPKFLYGQHNLRIFDMSNNKMRGEFPYWLLENNTRLEELYLYNNSLTGTIRLPSHSHVYLSTLDISTNFFTGQIPSKLGSYFPNLYHLDISHNELNGSFPRSISNLSSLSYLDLSINHLSGEIPEFLNCSLLKVLDISENYISGNLPTFSNRLNLGEVYLSKNKLQGSLAWAFSNSSYLNILVLNHNLLTGTLPKWIGNLSGLSFLQLGHNYLEGEIPIELCMLDDLHFIDLSNNNLSGQIPTCVKSNRHTDYYPEKPIEFTTKSFSYSYKGIALQLLVGIDFSCNKLTGQIPFEFGNLTSIKLLNLSRNSLRGSIPSSFSNLEEIETLDLSHNNLEGTIPSQLTQLKSISSFSVAYNNLSGRTPDLVMQFATFENTSYEGNPFLCGKPLSKSCEATISPSPLPWTSTNNEADDGFMDMEVFYVSFGVSYVMVLLGIVAVLYINPCWRKAWFYFIERKMTGCYYFIVDLFKL